MTSCKIVGNLVKTHVCQNSNSPSKLGSPYCANGHGLEVESELVVHSSAHLENLTPSQAKNNEILLIILYFLTVNS